MNSKLVRIAKDTNFYLNKFLNKQNNSELISAMKYGLFPGGKKIRSKILIDVGRIFNLNNGFSINFDLSGKTYNCNFSNWIALIVFLFHNCNSHNQNSDQ